MSRPRTFACWGSIFELHSNRTVKPLVPRGLSGSEKACRRIYTRPRFGRLVIFLPRPHLRPPSARLSHRRLPRSRSLRLLVICHCSAS
ncbi:hypothetical protein K523DRAFT_13560 [Schizophyllum commune Tattone D]|nr:hypothetical protein K523DRAFT_13560 [Schizophyllum commune Tattone D]